MSEQERGDKLRHNYGLIDKDYAVALATRAPESDGPIWMVNLMKYREVAAYDDGRGIEISGRQADDLYNPSKILSDIGADIMFVADVVGNHGQGDPWDRIAIVRYPTRRSFIDMQSRRDFADKHKHKAAGMERTIIIGCRPSDPSLDARQRPRPAEPRDLVMTVLGSGHKAAAGDAVTLRAEGTIIGDGRSWSHVGFSPGGHTEAETTLAGLGEAPGGRGAFVLSLRTVVDGITS